MNSRDPLRRSRLGLRGLLVPAAGVLLCTSVLLLPACTPDPPAPPQSGSSNVLPAGPLAEAGSASGEQIGSDGILPVYWVGDSSGSALLYREFTGEAAPESVGDPIADAVRLMTAGRPFDPDFHSLWEPASMVTTSISARNVITVDLSADAFRPGLHSSRAHLAIQQLVFTATAAAANAGLIGAGETSSVVLLVDGKAGSSGPAGAALDGELRRDPSLVAPVWIINPQDGDVRDPSTVVVSGSGRSDSSTLNWRITSLDRLKGGIMPTPGQRVPGATVKEGKAELDGSPGTTGEYEFTVALPPGRYEIAVFRLGAGDAEEFADTKTIEIK
ncbi:GerMN domain-containing protein [Arthrobacter sp. MSA 4-2]|uniref:GerMN domain-containing protein n=1 Tax=Arthrobacter sp. MSA 4-2 TaxID=2794349 RepID=UPI0018E71F89|nr:GerMN domain-containing protein [Arthrobacter sp. MSA 4-2]MBJ2119839.1 GerMN domain-containing protein [Arthrobacter sp. MSA 4-2]